MCDLQERSPRAGVLLMTEAQLWRRESKRWKRADGFSGYEVFGTVSNQWLP